MPLLLLQVVTESTASGTLDVKVVNADGFTLNGNKIWNAGNVTFNSTNVVSTAVIRDASGNFAAGTITANLTGAASQNVLKIWRYHDWFANNYWCWKQSECIWYFRCYW
jgi:hypothetical protein